MGSDLHLDHHGIAAVLTSSEIAGAVNGLAHQLAAGIVALGHQVNHDREDLPVTVEEYTTDRRAASVTLAHPAGLAMQAKYGLLTAAAASQGLEVRSS